MGKKTAREAVRLVNVLRVEDTVRGSPPPPSPPLSLFSLLLRLLGWLRKHRLGIVVKVEANKTFVLVGLRFRLILAVKYDRVSYGTGEAADNDATSPSSFDIVSVLFYITVSWNPGENVVFVTLPLVPQTISSTQNVFVACFVTVSVTKSVPDTDINADSIFLTDTFSIFVLSDASVIVYVTIGANIVNKDVVMFVIDRAMDDRAPDCLYSSDQSLSLYLEAVVDARVVVTPNITINKIYKIKEYIIIRI